MDDKNAEALKDLESLLASGAAPHLVLRAAYQLGVFDGQMAMALANQRVVPQFTRIAA